MGLDVTLYYCKNVDDAIAIGELQQNLNRTSDKDKFLLENPLCFKYGDVKLSKFNYDTFNSIYYELNTGASCVAQEGDDYNVGYFRSSYNEYGFNNVMRNLDIPDLYEVFNVQNPDMFFVKVDWNLSIKRAEKAKNQYLLTKHSKSGNSFVDYWDNVIYTINYVLEKEHPENYCLDWSH